MWRPSTSWLQEMLRSSQASLLLSCCLDAAAVVRARCVAGLTPDGQALVLLQESHSSVKQAGLQYKGAMINCAMDVLQYCCSRSWSALAAQVCCSLPGPT